MILWSGQFLGWEVNCINKLLERTMGIEPNTRFSGSY
jgi:hypothetical protein